MKKVVSLTESKLIKLITNLVEQNTRFEERHDDMDYFHAFNNLFISWVSEKLGGDVQKYPFSYLLKKYGYEFLQTMIPDHMDQSGLSSKGNIHLNWHNMPRLGKLMVDKGLVNLPTLRPSEKFTEKFAKKINYILDKIDKDLPSWAHLKLSEDQPNDIEGELIINFPEMLKSDETKPDPHKIEKKMKDYLQDFLGVDVDNPLHGGINLSVYKKYAEEESWIKNVLNKKLKKEIKQLPDGKYIHSMSFTVPTYANPELKIRYKSEGGWSKRYTLRETIKKYLADEGYKKIQVTD